MDSTASSTSSSPRFHSSRRCRSHSGTSSMRGDQPPGWKGEMVSFHEITSSKRDRSRSKPGISSGPGAVSGVAALLETSRMRREAGRKHSVSRAAASVATPYRVDAMKICVVMRRPPWRRDGGAAGAAGWRAGRPWSRGPRRARPAAFRAARPRSSTSVSVPPPARTFRWNPNGGR